MRAAAFVVLLLGCACLSVSGHPTYYPELKDTMDCYNASVLPTIRSYHIHVLFLGYENVSTNAALALHDEFVETFQPQGICPSLYHQDFLCMFQTQMQPSGPFPTAQWAAFIPVEYFPKTVPWIMQRRQVQGVINAAGGPGVPIPPFDVLIHPNSGCEYQDHGDWMMWAGQPWRINMWAMDTENPFGPGPMKTHAPVKGSNGRTATTPHRGD